MTILYNKEELIKYLIQGNKSKEETWDSIAKKFGLSTGEAARNVWKKYRKGLKNIDESPSTVVGKESFEENIKEGKAILETGSLEQITSLEQLVKYCKIDTSIWEIERYVQNYWGNAKHPHWQVKAWLVKKKVDVEDKLIEVLKNYKSTFKPLPKQDLLLNKFESKPVSVLISLADPHLDKKTIDGSTMEGKVQDYTDILQSLAFRAYNSHYLEEIVFVLGNDYFTSDNYFPSTTKGTPQFVTDEFDQSYEKGFDLAVKSISLLSTLCVNVKVIFVPANHDRTKSFCMLHALEVYFKADEKISFDRTAENTKVHVYGNTSIGLHHGDTIMEGMPLYFASKFRHQWGSTKYTEIALADKHHKKEWKFSVSAYESKGTRMFISPALTAPDIWHKDKNYDLAILAGTARIYDKEKGFIGELEERV